MDRVWEGADVVKWEPGRRAGVREGWGRGVYWGRAELGESVWDMLG